MHQHHQGAFAQNLSAERPSLNPEGSGLVRDGAGNAPVGAEELVREQASDQIRGQRRGGANQILYMKRTIGRAFFERNVLVFHGDDSSGVTLDQATNRSSGMSVGSLVPQEAAVQVILHGDAMQLTR